VLGRRDADSPSQNKKIAVVHASDMLLNNTYPEKFRKRMESQLRAREIDLILGEYADQFPPSGSGELVLRSGRKINAGLVVSNPLLCTFRLVALITYILPRLSLLVRSRIVE